MTTYGVVFEMDDNGWWFVDAPEVNGAHSHGPTLARAKANIAEAIALMTDAEPGDVEVAPTFRLRVEVQSSVEAARARRQEAEEARREATERTRTAVADLRCAYGSTLSNRDIAELVGVSHQRVAQILSQATTKADA